MRTNIFAFIMSSEKRKKIVETLFEYPKRQWSCSTIEQVTKISHATTFRALQGLKEWGLLKSVKINKKDILYELVNFPLVGEIERAMRMEERTARRIAKDFVKWVKSKKVVSIILYGSSVRGGMKPGSDIDILMIVDKNDPSLAKNITNIAAKHSSKVNKTISVVIMNEREFKKEKGESFVKSVKENHEVLYGKDPF